jgi:glycosyltransferase involved in cell wall biosynthesis
VSPLALASSTLLAVFCGIALWNRAAATRMAPSTPRRRLRVSLLIPARNEAHNLAAVLPALSAIDYPQLEVIVLDDDSTDGTATLVRSQGVRDPRLRLLQGEPLPAGWLGKPWACHQLAEAARGELLIFCDADVTPVPWAIDATVAAMEETGADALSAMARQDLGSWMERALVPLVVHLPVIALLPLPLVARTSSAAVSYGNGQWLAFRRESYRSSGGHAAVRNVVLEDVALARRVKSGGARLVAALGRNALSVRMYGGSREIRDGFAKNLFPLLGGRLVPVALWSGVFVMTAVYPWVAAALGSVDALVPLGLLVVLRVVAARTGGHSVASIPLHPVGSVLFMAALVDSALRRGEVRWKGRTLERAIDFAPIATQRGPGVEPGRAHGAGEKQWT